MYTLQRASNEGAVRAASRIAQFESILPPPKLPPNAIVWTPTPTPLKHGFVGRTAGATAVATGTFVAATFVVLEYEESLDPFPLLLAEDVEVLLLVELPEPDTLELED